jgi:hypothetical protein
MNAARSTNIHLAGRMKSTLRRSLCQTVYSLQARAACSHPIHERRRASHRLVAAVILRTTSSTACFTSVEISVPSSNLRPSIP